MKTNRNLFGTLLVATSIGGWMILTPGLSAQESAARRDAPPAREARGDAAKTPDAMKMRQMMMQIAELRRAGKHDEARKMAERIRGVAGNNPRVAEALKRSMDGPRPEAKTDRRPDARPGTRPDARPDKAPENPAEPVRMKIEKLRQAAELLQSAGYGDQAVKARTEIGRIEQNVRREEAAAKARKTDQAPKANKSHRKDKSRGDRPNNAGPMMEELRKLRRDLEELRGEVRRMKAQAGPRPMPGRPAMDRPMNTPR